MGANIILKKTVVPFRNLELKKKPQLSPTTKKKGNTSSLPHWQPIVKVSDFFFADLADQATLAAMDATGPSGIHVSSESICKPGSTGTSAEGLTPFSDISGQQATELSGVDATSGQLQLAPPAAECLPHESIYQRTLRTAANNITSVFR